MQLRKCKTCDCVFSSSTPIPYILMKKFHWVKGEYCSYICIQKSLPAKTGKVTRSKSEILIFESLALALPKYSIISNDRKTIGLELDIYFPEIRVAIEVNGPVHRELIFNKKTLNLVKRNDVKKNRLCIDNNILLITIDITQVKTKLEADQIVQKEILPKMKKKLL